MAVWLLDALWRRLGIAETLNRLLGGRRFTTYVERVVFALVANRAVASWSGRRSRSRFELGLEAGDGLSSSGGVAVGLG